jgi:pimeloyl-ACP methyl ester carboxylesterase
VWSDQDVALMPKAAHNTGRYVTGEYRFEILPGVSHWIPDEQPDKLADLLLDWFASHPLH